MADNQHGKLYSIELPFSEYVDDDGRVLKETVPPDTIGVFVPEKLRDRWELKIGTSETVLENILKHTSPIDIFLHDSLHTYKNMSFEFQKSWPFIKKGGFLLSDDVTSNNAFTDFYKSIHVEPIIMIQEKTPLSYLGILKK